MKLTVESIAQINLFEQVTGANVKDCISREGILYFIIEEGSIQKAVRGLKKIESMLKKHVLIIGHSEDLNKFILN